MTTFYMVFLCFYVSMWFIAFFKECKKKCFLPLIIATAILPACNSSDKTPTNNSTTVSDTSKGEWTPLFNGKTFTGWHTYGTDTVGKAWKVEDSVIHLAPLNKNGWQSVDGGDLVTDKEYSDFDLKLEWKISEAGNSGIFFYVQEDINKFKNPNKSGLEMQINDDQNNKNGTIEKLRSGDLAGLLSSNSAKVTKPAGNWNQAEIRSERGKLDFFINGHHVLSTALWDDNWEELINDSEFEKVNDYGSYKKGRIALQDHGEDVWFRNIMIRKI